MVNHQVLDRTFAALADPTRRAMLTTLATGPRSISALAEPHAMSLVAASKHVTVLERAGLLDRARVGRSQVCTLRSAPLESAAGWLAEQRAFWTGQLDALADYLAHDDAPTRDNTADGAARDAGSGGRRS